MTNFLIIAMLTASTFTTATGGGVPLTIGQPGFYGRINIDGYPHPQLLYRQPIAIQSVPMARPPIYLGVAPAYAKRLKQHCRDYDACDERVFLVWDQWYQKEYANRHQENQRGHEQMNGDQGQRRGNHNGNRRNDNPGQHQRH